MQTLLINLGHGIDQSLELSDGPTMVIPNKFPLINSRGLHLSAFTGKTTGELLVRWNLFKKLIDRVGGFQWEFQNE